jgi:uncharacterized protein (TIGR02145 family)
MMKRLYITLVAIVFISRTFAQSPDKMSYQAVVRNSSNQLVTNQTIGVKISILQGTATGTAEYSETQTPKTNINGLVTIEIGGGIIISGTFATIDWANGPYFIKTETDLTGGTNYNITSTSQLLSVPYSFYAKTVGKDYGDSLKEIIYNELLSAGLNGVLFDIEGNAYKTIKIGSQVWMAENLVTTTLNDGTHILMVTDNAAWSSLITPAYCWYNNDLVTYGTTYGALYNWYTVNTGKLCPIGWHVSTDAEWTDLIDYLGGLNIAGGKLKEIGTTHWILPNRGATNESGFTALPGGYREDNGTFNIVGEYGYWWTSVEYSDLEAWRLEIYSGESIVYRSFYTKPYGYSVRCVRD